MHKVNSTANMDVRALELNYHYFLVFSLILLWPLLLFLLGRRKSNNGLNLPPGPYAWPIIGNILDMDGKKPHIALADLAKSFGPLLTLRFGSKVAVVASTPEVAREIYKFHDKELSGRLVIQLVKIIPGWKTSLIALAPECDESWRFLRATSHTELFSSQALESQSELRLRKAKDMLDILNTREGDVVKIADIIFATVANTLTGAMVSEDVIQSWDKIGETKRHVRKLIGFATPGLGDLYPSMIGLDFGSKRKLADYKEICQALWVDILRERRREKNGGVRRPDFLDTLIKNSWEDSHIYNILTEFLVSSETMTTVTEWAMAELMRNQQALTKLRDELSEATEGKLLMEHDLTKLPYLQACIKETLRLHPPTPILVPRTALQPCKIMNYNIPKNCVVVINNYALGRDSKTWEDPLSFKPERFLGKSIDPKGTNYELLPFGSGRRICAGFHLALKQIQLLLASLVLAFDWHLPPGTDPSNLDMSENFGITLRMENTLSLIPKRRNGLKIE